MKNRILVSLLILMLVAPQLFAALDKCREAEQKLDSAIEKMDKYCQGDFYDEKRCERYEQRVIKLEKKADKYCVPNQPY